MYKLTSTRVPWPEPVKDEPEFRYWSTKYYDECGYYITDFYVILRNQTAIKYTRISDSQDLIYNWWWEKENNEQDVAQDTTD